MPDPHELLLLRHSTGEHSTLGLLFWTSPERIWLAYTLEDPFNAVKIPGETRIPGMMRFKLRLRTWGGFHERYSSRYPDMHKGIIEVCDVPGFTDILIHIGNTAKDTRGCILLTDTQDQNVTLIGFGGSSARAYERVYPQIAAPLAAGHEVGLTVWDYA